LRIFGIQARINENGRIVIPAVIRKGMGLKLGDTVIMSLDDGILRIEAHRGKVHKIQKGLKNAEPAQLALNETQSERTGDLHNETEEWLG
jgi:AbrB family looped-hinge helix DNA binding protein